MTSSGFPDIIGPVLSNEEAREKLRQQLYLELGGGMIDIELDPRHYNLAIDKAIRRYRTRSKHSVEESFIFLEVQPEVTQYTLPNEVIEVRNIFRRGASGNTAGGTFFDPFSAAIVNSIYGIPFASGTGGNLSLYYIALTYQELVGRLFGINILYTWDKVTKKITFVRKFVAPETIVLWVYNFKPEGVLLSSFDSRNWIRRYALATLKMILGRARSYLQSIPGPGGGVSLNGDALKTEAQAEMEKLRQEISTQMEGADRGYWFVIG